MRDEELGRLRADADVGHGRAAVEADGVGRARAAEHDLVEHRLRGGGGGGRGEQQRARRHDDGEAGRWTLPLGCRACLAPDVQPRVSHRRATSCVALDVQTSCVAPTSTSLVTRGEEVSKARFPAHCAPKCITGVECVQSNAVSRAAVPRFPRRVLGARARARTPRSCRDQIGASEATRRVGHAAST